MHPFASNAYGCNGGIGGRRGGGGDIVCKRLALASAGVVSLGVASTVVVPIDGAVDDEGGGAGSRGDVATDNPHNSANAAASTTKVPRRKCADVIQNLPDSLQGAAERDALRRRSCSKKLSRQRNSGPKLKHIASYWAHRPKQNSPRSYVIRTNPRVYPSERKERFVHTSGHYSEPRASSRVALSRRLSPQGRATVRGDASSTSRERARRLACG